MASAAAGELLAQLGAGLLEALELLLYANHQLVSGVLWVVSLLVLTAYDVVDQYTEHCWALAAALDQGLSWLGAGIASVGRRVVLLLHSLLAAGRLIPTTIWGWCLNVAHVLTYPWLLVQLITDGLAQIAYLAYSVVVWTASSIYWCVASVLHLIKASALAWLRVVWRCCLAPVHTAKRIAIHLYETPSEALYGLVICALLVCFVRSGAAARVWRCAKSAAKRFLLWCMRQLLRLAEALLWLLAPQLAATLTLYRWIAFALFECACWAYEIVYSARLRLTYLWSPPSNDERLTGVVCLVRERRVLLQPCAHICLCRQCVLLVRTCPICRRHIRSHSNVFL